MFFKVVRFKGNLGEQFCLIRETAGETGTCLEDFNGNEQKLENEAETAFPNT